MREIKIKGLKRLEKGLRFVNFYNSLDESDLLAHCFPEGWWEEE